MNRYNGHIMSGDTVVAEIENGNLRICNNSLVPLYIKRTKNIEGWLSSRAIDTHRTNSRLLRKALRIKTSDNAEIALAVNAATITDSYWFRPEGSSKTYADVKFDKNYFDNLALYGDPDGFSQLPSKTPELTNIGSYEKCWKLIDNHWWMYKSGNNNEYFSELFICRLGEKLGFPMAHYEMDGSYIRSVNFTEENDTNFEPVASLVGDNDDYNDCFELLYSMNSVLSKQYLEILYMDSLCYNMDRHTFNFGFLRSKTTGEILSMAPNYDNNIALISRGYPKNTSRETDGLIRFFREFMDKNALAREMIQSMEIPEITESIVLECIRETGINVESEIITEFILNGQKEIRKIINS